MLFCFCFSKAVSLIATVTNHGVSQFKCVFTRHPPKSTVKNGTNVALLFSSFQCHKIQVLPKMALWEVFIEQFCFYLFSIRKRKKKNGYLFLKVP